MIGTQQFRADYSIQYPTSFHINEPFEQQVLIVGGGGNGKGRWGGRGGEVKYEKILMPSLAGTLLKFQVAKTGSEGNTSLRDGNDNIIIEAKGATGPKGHGIRIQDYGWDLFVGGAGANGGIFTDPEDSYEGGGGGGGQGAEGGSGGKGGDGGKSNYGGGGGGKGGNGGIGAEKVILNTIKNPPFTSNTSVDVSGTEWASPLFPDTGWTVSAKSIFSDFHKNWYAFNHTANNYQDCWHSGFGDAVTSSDPQWLSIAFPIKVFLDSYEITSRGGNHATWFPSEWVVQGKSDSGTWINVENSTRQESSWNSGETKTYNSNFTSDRGAFQVYRMYISNSQRNSNDTDNSFVAIGNWQLNVQPSIVSEENQDVGDGETASSLDGGNGGTPPYPHRNFGDPDKGDMHWGSIYGGNNGPWEEGKGGKSFGSRGGGGGAGANTGGGGGGGGGYYGEAEGGEGGSGLIMFFGKA
ncbi:hypothetical protein DUNSADRAFT_7358 [Dunaliella salina]|uniref:Uncharacterized protein n=1 Tax=Dunaliella salina TaxID=3046 RepID=A0ABQ7FUF4_DUNSA|nr:hypothetical protein DUNSADRAFT_7358 [Dunaliella salina]|eukprot:KAF5825716.1 hypothetical protein DUNSADRAFT_7358 [Dunaliella salina]